MPLFEMNAETVISLLAVVLSATAWIHSIRTSRRLNELAERNAEYELRAHQEAEERSQRADPKVRLERNPGQIVLWNDGEAIAEDVGLVITREDGTSPIVRHDRRKLPLARLHPGRNNGCRFSALVAWEIEKEFNCVITWRDSRGGEQRKELPLYV